jgi:uncharacterized membrane protein
MKATFRRTFITGMLIILPVLVTIWVISLMFSLLDGTVTPTILQVLKLVTLGRLSEATWVRYVAPVVSVTLSVLFIYVLGLIGTNVFGRQILGAVDKWLRRIPLVRGIYSATRQFVDTFQSGSGAYSHVVLLEYPRAGVWTMAFVTNEAQGEVQKSTGKTLMSVFVPTTPNPTSGFLLFVPEEQLLRLRISVDDAFKMIISGGVLTPETTTQLESEPPTTALVPKPIASTEPRS